MLNAYAKETKMQTNLYVPFPEKDEAKNLGARWNQDERTWFAPDGADLSRFSKWAQPKVHVNKELYVDLVPSSSWFANLRSELKTEEWTAVRQNTYRRASYKCEICGGRGSAHPVEAHERWSFDSAKKLQTLVQIESLCPACHEVTHIGLASLKGRETEALEHLMKVNGWTEEQASEHVNSAFDTWHERSKINWDFDMSHLLNLGIELSSDTLAKMKIDSANRTAVTKNMIS